MKKNRKKMHLSKHSISLLNAHEIKGGAVTITLVTAICPTRIYYGEDLCWTMEQK